MREAIILLEDIKIRSSYKRIQKEKLDHRRKYYEDNKDFFEEIYINKKGYLNDGYSTYLIANEKGIKFLACKIASRGEMLHFKLVRRLLEAAEMNYKSTINIFKKNKLKRKIAVLKEMIEKIYKEN